MTPVFLTVEVANIHPPYNCCHVGDKPKASSTINAKNVGGRYANPTYKKDYQFNFAFEKSLPFRLTV
ncbi:hypothetical protein D3C75_1209600 [compost metagenome]